MAKIFSPEWPTIVMEKLNSDARYARMAHEWEGDLRFVIEPNGPLTERVVFYIDLWHGTCRAAYLVNEQTIEQPAAFTLNTPYETFVNIIKGKQDASRALVTRRVIVQGNLIKLMANIPTVQELVRCIGEATDGYL